MLDVKTLTARYGRAQILSDVTLSVGENEVVALLGRNGAGKSTTIKSVMGLVQHVSGQVTYDGQAILGRASHMICRAGLGYVPEERRIFGELTVEENLEVGRREPRADAPEWTFEHLFELFPNLAERRRNLGKQLSGGEQQMLTIARTLMGNPRLVLLDEPSEGIAPVIVEQMATIIGELKREGLSVLISEQNLHFARIVSDRAYIIEKGQMRYEGSFAHLDAHPDISTRYLAV
ncbi:amino acid/amide ABC transporter ATP-binding protein 2, HAAT family [Cribrihabitans marinus]|uniref:Amino acid/amide ABC transporter ATP-binding protein 2, HAAT family n=1 Tax=Cribrihabitans marinus TaxID=1227549 RepID=A0A1H6SSC9_9RHOB|nr:ABC transporter ATP-binding protein [Cribrihabitans marinus]GGH23315.1 ABC transporter ATP-binding protein [Cribrihabitans marinus]SEI67697.1 amino acid/amide ABC transporter ATP-binding protein 2, HAAT family [Cribrihabitans marinus]